MEHYTMITKTDTQALQVLFNHYMVADRALKGALKGDDNTAIVEALDKKQTAHHALLELGIDMDYTFESIGKRGMDKAFAALNAAEAKLGL